MIDKRATVVILVLAAAAACGGWWLQQRMLAPSAAAPATPAAPASTPSPSLRIGDVADDLTLPDLQGKSQRLSQWRGRRVLVNFWATWCVPCRKEMPALSAAQARHPEVRVVGIALDQPKAVRDFLEQRPVDYSILIGIDADPEPTLRFGDTVGALPYSVLIGPDGRIERNKLGPLSDGELAEWLQ